MQTSDQLKEHFRTKLKELRITAGLTQAEVSEEAGLPPLMWSFYETGERMPSLENLRKLCIALDVSADTLLML